MLKRKLSFAKFKSYYEGRSTFSNLCIVSKSPLQSFHIYSIVSHFVLNQAFKMLEEPSTCNFHSIRIMAIKLGNISNGKSRFVKISSPF